MPGTASCQLRNKFFEKKLTKNLLSKGAKKRVVAMLPGEKKKEKERGKKPPTIKLKSENFSRAGGECAANCGHCMGCC